MKQAAIISAIALFSILAAWASDYLSEPSDSPISAEYRQKIAKYREKDNLTEQEMNELRELGDEYVSALTAPEQMNKDLKSIIMRKSIIVPMLIAVYFYAALKLGIKSNNVIIGGAAVILLVFIAFSNVVEAVMYSGMFASVLLVRKRRREKT